MLAKKGSRTITVNGFNYRWRANNKNGRLLVTIQQPESNGQMLVMKIADDRWDMSQWERAVGPVTPKLVEKMIAFGLEKGWQPKNKDKALELECPDSFHENSQGLWMQVVQ